MLSNSEKIAVLSNIVDSLTDDNSDKDYITELKSDYDFNNQNLDVVDFKKSINTSLNLEPSKESDE